MIGLELIGKNKKILGFDKSIYESFKICAFFAIFSLAR